VTSLLDVTGLGRTFGGLKAVNDFHFSLQADEILGLIGPNGAGKTTLVNLLSGVIKPTTGKILLQGENVTGLAPHKLARKGLVRTFQSTTVYGARTVRENALRGAYFNYYPGFVPALLGTAAAKAKRAKADALVAQLLSWFALDKVADSVAGSLPYGYQKTLGIVIALAAEPRLIMLDEPVAGLSAEETDHVRDAILQVRKRGISVLVIDHNMRFISGLCDRVVVVAAGRELAQGKPQDVLRQPEVIEAYLGKSHVTAGHQ
jgi:branched-chain amino acid transport system ATP-binding protein